MSAFRKAAFRVALAALIAGAAAGAVLQGSAYLAHGGSDLDPWWWWLALFASALAGGLAAAVVVRRSFGGRLTTLAESLDARVKQSDFLQRVPEMGEDEVGRIARSFNRVLAQVTMLQGDLIDGQRELAVKQRELELADELAEKQRELEQRLTERSLLFEVLRESTSSHDLDRVLDVLVTRIGPALRASRLAVLLRTDDGGLEIGAAWGFEESPVGRSVDRPSGGPWALDHGVMVVPDVSRAPRAVGFWDELPRTGSFAAIPITHADDEIGLLVLTRPEHDPLGELAARYLEAVAAQAALAIHNAQLVKRLEELATHDELTGLPNRRLFDRRLVRALAYSDRYGHELSLLALDIDHFKHLNDTHGHAAGDAALVALAHILEEHTREVDTVARVGGEELWVLLPQTGPDAAAEVAEKLRAEIAALEVRGAESQPLGRFSVSIGVAARDGREAQAALLGRADAALYEAKRGGRDRVVTSRPDRAAPARSG
ncbi:MAG: diguanylate cyclase [Sandaracinaceae bacterium]|nr:diguanylate cyclase [Sandaracinaceae bacterium]